MCSNGRAAGGGITIFLAIIYLSLIVFSCSIVEVTRINIARVQAERSMISASQSVLGGYDRYLKDHYGIFARSTNYADVTYTMDGQMRANSTINGQGSVHSLVEEDYKYYTNANLQNHPSLQRESLIDAVVFHRPSTGYWDFYQTTLLDLSVVGYEPLVTSDIADRFYVKDEMVSFMELRVPMLLLQPLLEKLEAYEKVGKTGQFIEEKNEVIEMVAEIEESYSDLYELIEGVSIDETSGAIEMLETNYIKRLVVDSVVSNYPEGYFNGASLEMNGIAVEQKPFIRDLMADQTIMISDEIDGLVKSVEQVGVVKVVIKNIEDVIKSKERTKDSNNQRIKQAIADMEAAIKSVVEAMEEAEEAKEVKEVKEVKEANIEIPSTEEIASAEIESIKKYYGAIISDYEKLNDELSSDIKKKKKEKDEAEKQLENERLVADKQLKVIESLTEGSESFLESNISAGVKIREMQELLIYVDGEIQTFKDEHEKEQSEIISGAYDQSMEELELIRQSYGLGDISVEQINDLGQMLDHIESNVQVLETSHSKISVFRTKQTSLFDLPVESGLASNGEYTEIEASYLSQIESIKGTLLAYNSELYFDYSSYGSYSNEVQEEAQGLLTQLKAIVESFDLSKVFEDIPPNDIDLLKGHPSSNYSADISASGGGEAGGGSFGENIKALIYLNEYAVGMFCSYPDKEDDTQLTLTGQAKSSHVLDTEVEYILTGELSSADALRNVLLMIFGLRVVCNMIHLLTDTSKRTTIMKVSNAIAGWWSLGAGAIIVAAIISLLWASAESMVDLMMLVNNRKVPLIKMTTSWYTSLDGNMNDLVGLGVVVAEKSVVKVIDIASGEVSRMITEVSGVISEETSQFYSDETKRIYEDGMNIIEAQSLLIEDEEERAKQLLEWTMNFDQQIIAYAEEVNGEIADYAAKGKEAASDMIHQKSQAFLEKVNKNKSNVDGGGSGSGKNNGLSLVDIVPNLGYHDYLRIFMFVDGKSLNERVYRMMDLIDLNLAYAHPERDSNGMPSTRLKHYTRSVEAEGTFELEVGLFLLPFFKYRNQNGDSKYQFKVVTSNGYE